MNIGLHNIFLKRNAESRSISAENPRGKKGKGGMATETTSLLIAALADAEIEEASKQLIAHGNLAQLLELPTLETKSSHASPDADDRLWDTFLRGRPLQLDAVDAHGHLGPLGRWVVGDGELEEQIADAIHRMDKLGIQTMIVSGTHALFSDPVAGNRLLEKSLSDYGELFKGYLVFNPFYRRELEPSFEDFFLRPFFVGFKMLCDYWRVPLTDPRFEPVWEYAHEHRLPILMHTWEGQYNSPSMLKDIVKRYPDANYLLGHSGGGSVGRSEAEELARTNRNVYLEWCGSFTTPLPFEETLQRVGKERVIFGTDGILHSFAWELGRLLSMDLPDKTLAPILGANMRKILSQRR